MKHQAEITEIIELLKPSHTLEDADESGIPFKANSGAYIGRITQSGINFNHPTNPEIAYSYGFSHMKDIRGFLRQPPTFDEASFKEQAAAPKERKPRLSTAKRDAKTTPKPDKGPTARGTIFKMLGEGAAKDAILAAVKLLDEKRDEKAIKAQIYLHRSEFTRGLVGADGSRKKPAADAPAETPAPEAAPETVG